MTIKEHRTAQIVRDHLLQPDAATPPEALARAIRVETAWGSAARRLADRVGGLTELQSLETTPHGDEPFDWASVGDADGAFVGDVVVMLDRFCDEWLDVEYRTIMRRLLALVLRTDASPLRRSSKPPRIAAGIARAVVEGNGLLGRSGAYRTGGGRGLRAGDVDAWFGTSSAGDPARSLVRAAGLDGERLEDERWSWPSSIELRSAALLHSRMRRLLVEERRMVIGGFLDEEQRRAGRRPMVTLDEGRVELRGCAADVAFVRKGTTGVGQLTVMLAMAPLVAEPELELFGLTVPEARRLQQLLEQALDAPAVLLRAVPRGS